MNESMPSAPVVENKETIPRRKLSRRKKLLFLGITLGLPLLMIALVGEIICRVLAPATDGGAIARSAPAGSGRVRELIPHAKALVKGAHIQINSVGFREKEYPLTKPAGVYRIAVIGDSYTFGVGVEFEQIFAKQLEKRLQDADLRCEVVSFGVGGYDTVQELALYREIVAAYQADLVLLAYVINDVDGGSRAKGSTTTAKSAARKREGGWRSMLNKAHIRLKDYSKFYLWIAPRIRSITAGGYVIGSNAELKHLYRDDSPAWNEIRDALLAFQAETTGAHTLFAVAIFPFMLDYSSYPLKEEHAKIQAFCEQHQIPVVDLLGAFKDDRASRYQVFLDGHPNGQAHGILAAELERFLRASRLLPTPGPGASER